MPRRFSAADCGPSEQANGEKFTYSGLVIIILKESEQNIDTHDPGCPRTLIILFHVRIEM